MDEVLGPFTSKQVANLAGLPYPTLQYWQRSGFIRPSVRGPSGNGRGKKQLLYGFADVVEVRTAIELRKAGIALQGLRQIVSYLRSYNRTENPLASSRLLATTSGDVLGIVEEPDLVVSLLKNQSQLVVIALSFGALVHSLREKARSVVDTKTEREVKLAAVS